ncbi:MAG: hypothetical protein A2X42_11635 [Candidatus Margulisbacteria bacterium GWF2_38_17]|nr:MAG: hypothetical protein A2X43_12395 [Candidatus Margulisbacteria bacterium GWD2_39_127]OGI03253.1 MAG: hypothetical protein A2X42_11635 [Candidatus Margulisbacteria bacterium GWF2_38_17]OGI11276.1 MAG: hypothetical protein A2X41_04060 [Candidatus Margulisbacteria bacterium GWE2_39_32]
MNNIYLIGFMGVGKTSVGTLLAGRMECQLVDTDKLIEEAHQCEVSTIFSQFGEPHFRQLESAQLKELSGKQGLIVSTGGGIILSEKNVTVMRETGIVVLLTATPETIVQRLSHDTTRPLLQGDDKFQKIMSILDARKEKYLGAAHFTVATDDLKLEIIAEIIVNHIHQHKGVACG